jgi:hypothetical protein
MAKAKKKTPVFNYGDHVYIIRGPCAGRVGQIDSDDDDGYAVEFFLLDYVVVKAKNLRLATDDEILLEWKEHGTALDEARSLNMTMEGMLPLDAPPLAEEKKHRPLFIATWQKSKFPACGGEPPLWAWRPQRGTVARSYWENGNGEVLLTCAGTRLFGFSHSDREWKELTIEVSPTRNYAALVKEIIATKISISFNGIMLDQAEAGWLQSVLLAASARFDHQIAEIAAETAAPVEVRN